MAWKSTLISLESEMLIVGLVEHLWEFVFSSVCTFCQCFSPLLAIFFSNVKTSVSFLKRIG